MANRTIHPLAKGIAVGFAAVPLCFGIIRAATTGTDFRYLVVAVASLAAAAAVFRFGPLRMPSRWLRSAVALVASILSAIAVAWWQGARSVPAMAAVAIAFAVCNTVAGWLGLFSRRAA